MAGSRLNPTLFDKLTKDPELDAQRQAARDYHYLSSSQLEQFNERALRTTVRRELNWILNTTNLGAVEDLEPFPEVKTSVLNYGVADLTGKTGTRTALLARAKAIKDAVKTFEPRLDAARLEVELMVEKGSGGEVTYIIRGDITAAVEAMPVEFKTDIERDLGLRPGQGLGPWIPVCSAPITRSWPTFAPPPSSSARSMKRSLACWACGPPRTPILTSSGYWKVWPSSAPA